MRSCVFAAPLKDNPQGMLLRYMVLFLYAGRVLFTRIDPIQGGLQPQGLIFSTQ